MYKPLPDSVFIRESTIHGYGLFARTPIKKGTHLGVSHVYAPGFEGSYIRTPVGGFINHSETPNCHKVESPEESMLTYYSLVTSRDIPADAELTLSYTLYNVEKDN
jgi:SET domain-containing protein